MKELVIATHNKGKKIEIGNLLSGYGVSVKTADEFNIPEPEETGITFEENALLKARHACKIAGIPALADDSGFCVHALDNQPGVYSARWAGEDKNFQAAMAKINDMLGDSTDRVASFVCCIALVFPNGEEQTYEGVVEGHVVWPPRGEKGFGYDPIFVPGGEKQSFAEMSMEEKQALSHRGKALRKFIRDQFE